MRKRLCSVLLSLALLTMLLAVGCQPAAETPAVETPAVEAPAVETPEAETPAAETPAAETPEAGETPVAEGPGELPVTGGGSFTFWAAPNPPQEAFWSEMAQMYMEQYPDVQIEVRAMPEAPTSEAGIQAALAGGNAPAASENIFIGFGGELFRSDALVPLNEMEGWDQIIEARNMTETIQGWEFEDGNYYVLPIYSNAILFAWRLDLLQELGVEQPPRTYQEILDLGTTLQEQMPDTFIWARQPLVQNTWYERWFDFFVLYYAASGGEPLITGNELTADDDAAIAVLTWLQQLAQQNLLLTQEVTDPFEQGIALATQLGPWTFSAWAEQYPDLQYGETFTVTAPPVPEGRPEDQPVNTFADAKGLVIYAQADEETQQLTWHFIRWVFSDPQNDLAWFQRTNLPPARDDLATNEAFSAFYEESPALRAYADAVPQAVPPPPHPNYTEIQVALGDEAIIPVVMGQKEPQQAWEDWKNAVQPMLQAQ
jgi:multiple sugar transport system substrate-binding protein